MLLLTELVVCRRSWRPTATDTDQPTRPEMMLLKIVSVISLCCLSVTNQQHQAENQQVVGQGRIGCWLQTDRQKDQQPTLNIALSFGSRLLVSDRQPTKTNDRHYFKQHHFRFNLNVYFNFKPNLHPFLTLKPLIHLFNPFYILDSFLVLFYYTSNKPTINLFQTLSIFIPL